MFVVIFVNQHLQRLRYEHDFLELGSACPRMIHEPTEVAEGLFGDYGIVFKRPLDERGRYERRALLEPRWLRWIATL